MKTTTNKKIVKLTLLLGMNVKKQKMLNLTGSLRLLSSDFIQKLQQKNLQKILLLIPVLASR